MRSIRRGVPGKALAGLIILCSIGWAIGCSPRPTAQSDVARPVRTMVVEPGGRPLLRTFPGKVEASQRVELAFQVPGLIVNLPVKEGDRVAKGDVIAQLRPDDFQARLQALQGQLDQARAALRALRAGERVEERMRRESQVRAARARMQNARTEHERNTRLLERNAVSRSEYDMSETNYRVAQEDYEAALQLVEKGAMGRDEDIEAQEAAVRGLEGRVAEANIQLSDTTLRAPYDGVIARRFVEPNQNVQAKQPVVQFQDIEELDIHVDVPENVMAADIQTADILELTAEFSGAPGVTFPVRIREIAQAADPTTQTFQVRVAMPAPKDMRILPGMTATVTALYRRASVLGLRLLVPVSAVFRSDEGGQIVWVVGTDNTVSRRPVTLGTAIGGQIEIVEGLEPGERIAVAGVSFLRNGMEVRDLGDALGGGPTSDASGMQGGSP
jgi:multidrug efflux system membrane fusion protein